jgi:hypothetical protein
VSSPRGRYTKAAPSTVCPVADHQALKLDDVRWAALTSLGVQQRGTYAIDLRQCAAPGCGSTLARRC